MARRRPLDPASLTQRRHHSGRAAVSRAVVFPPSNPLDQFPPHFRCRRATGQKADADAFPWKLFESTPNGTWYIAHEYATEQACRSDGEKAARESTASNCSAAACAVPVWCVDKRATLERSPSELNRGRDSRIGFDLLEDRRRGKEAAGMALSDDLR